jgi:hypothetical protein
MQRRAAFLKLLLTMAKPQPVKDELPRGINPSLDMQTSERGAKRYGIKGGGGGGGGGGLTCARCHR